ncbi:MAG: TetR family transcriptional regulator C-terminal domain-containing protein [Planctomycetes bacterium]|nr:TetR family transcriptional regulator C-terminal domain-containing protein [Planctomycetota bacterium]MCB9905920.1 TetR family transcriptional regulator C-terminal domain-containing protein [Planctomycetota bacterium]
MGSRQRVAAKRENLLDLGVEQLRTSGYHGTGIQQVVGLAGIPKGSFYAYYPSKEAFAAAVVRRYAELFQAELDRMLEASRERPRAALRDFFDGLVERFVANGARGGCLIGNLGAELEGTAPAVSLALRETMGAWRTAFADVIARAQQRGEVASGRSPGLLADFLINAWEGALLRMKVESRVDPLRECLELLFDELLAPSAAGPSS